MSLILALALAATPSQTEVIGTLNTMQTAVLAARAGQRTLTQNGAKTRVCIAFTGNGSAPVGSVTVRYGVVVLSPQLQAALGLARPSYATTWQDVRDEYAAVEVQGVPDANPAFARLLDNMDVVREEVDKRASPLQATCEVYVVRRDDAAAVFSCACSSGSNCTWTPPLASGGVGASTAAPVHQTLPPGTWSGTGCVDKPCVTRFIAGKDETWPATCP